VVNSPYQGCLLGSIKTTRHEFLRAIANPLEIQKKAFEEKTERFRRITGGDIPEVKYPALFQENPVKIGLVKLEMQNLLKKQMEDQLQQMVKFHKDQEQVMRDFWDNLLRESDDNLTNRLQDPIPMMRWLTIKAIAKKRVHREKELIDLLSDGHPLVRQAARESLVTLSRGNDFGPPPFPTPIQFEVARQQWRQWLSMQEFPIQSPGGGGPP
jgi:hypothetical protein